MREKIFLMLGVCILLSFALHTPLLSQQTSGYYFGLSVPYSRLTGGSFDGITELYTGDILMAVPKTAGAPGVGVHAGFRQGPWEFELTYFYSGYGSRFLNPLGEEATDWLESTSPSHNFLLDIRRLFPVARPLALYAQFGIGYCLLSVRDAFYYLDASDAWTKGGDVQYSGLGFQTGGGIDIPLSQKNIDIYAQALFRFLLFSKGKTIYRTPEFTQELSYSLSDVWSYGIGASLGVRFGFYRESSPRL